MGTANEFLRFEILKQGDYDQMRFGYIHALSIVAISPSFIRQGSGIVLLNGGTIFVEESPDTVIDMLRGNDE